ncbi:hypothetical protein ABE61_05260 [Lysinibacillus sphaericus]|uniref:hypothetical protein n=1 Tax=Lysinibacillus sphaericus TaxID=1421 RepID=UPI0018CF1BA5|nr:hypothetical protein [Lysinibacillus sphaericus]MBG9453503.1 hypothetical protein [Lysinibacillus sphaericus]MBG9480354.1 hypothetical protein [Lysinibacillus sphaericus]MBG9595033.1 hypothetical protein [Lysinibacillus sphaericus]
MTSISRKYGKNLFKPNKIMEQYKDVKSLEKLSAEELDKMISTTEYEIQRVTSNKGLLLSTLSIVFTLLLVLVTNFVNFGPKSTYTVTNSTVPTFVLIITYVIIMTVCYIAIVNNIKKYYEYLNELRFVKENK